MQKHIFFDFDNTLLDGFSTSNFYTYLAENKLVNRSSEIISMHTKVNNEYKTGQADYNKATDIMMGIMAFTIAGLSQNELFELVKQFIFTVKIKLFDYTLPLLEKFNSDRYTSHIVTAAIPEVVESYMEPLNFKINISATEFERDINGLFSGKVLRVNNAERKINYINKFTPGASTVAIGDSVGDFPMLECVDFGALINPEEEDEKAAGGRFIILRTSDVNEIFEQVGRGLRKP